MRARTDLVALIGETVSLSSRNGGRDFLGLCPFHDDHNPSFHVYPDRQTYRCWVCNEGGDCFSFVMKHDAVEFFAALETLATRAGLELPRTGRSGPQGDSRNRLYDVIAWAEREYHQFLVQAAEAQVARDYLKGRGFTDETVVKYRLGFHPRDWEWLQARARGKYTADELFAARLVRERRERGGYFDDFVNRVMFPIHDERGRPVAFGGRVLPGNDNPEAPKYLNSPESPVFSKSRLLWGLDHARDAIKRTETAVVVEGYTDCITAHQCGVQNVVGTLGTALTETHVTNLKRFARRVVLVYDGDAAGQMAAERALAKFLVQEVDLRILTLPEGKDPADVLLGEGGDAFNARIEAAVEAWEHKLHLCIARYGLKSIDGRDRIVEEMLGLLSQVPGSKASRVDMVLRRLAQRVAVDERVLRSRLKDLRSGAAKRRRIARADSAETAPIPTKAAAREEALEQDLLEAILAAPETVTAIQQHVSPEEITDAQRQQVLQLCYDLAEQGVEPTCERMTAALEDADLKRLVVRIDLSAREKNVAEKIREGVTVGGTDAGLLQQMLRRFDQRRRERQHAELKEQASQLSGTALNPNSMEFLRRSSDYHAQRVNTKATT